MTTKRKKRRKIPFALLLVLLLGVVGLTGCATSHHHITMQGRQKKVIIVEQQGVRYALFSEFEGKKFPLPLMDAISMNIAPQKVYWEVFLDGARLTGKLEFEVEEVFVKNKKRKKRRKKQIVGIVRGFRNQTMVLRIPVSIRKKGESEVNFILKDAEGFSLQSKKTVIKWLSKTKQEVVQ